MRTPEQIIGEQAVRALMAAGYEIKPVELFQPDLVDTTDTDFDAIWAIYPHKVAKEAARRAYRAARRAKFRRDFLFDELRRYIETKRPDAPWMHLSTFLTGRRWNDAPAMVRPQAKGADLFFQSAQGDVDGYSRGTQSHSGPADGRLQLAGHSGNR
jgi:hypothetical protein